MKFITSLTIKHRDGSLDIVNGAKLEFISGQCMDVKADPLTNTVSLSAGPEAGEPDPSLIAKYSAVINGGSGEVDGVPYLFSGAPYYLSRLGNSFPMDGSSYLLSKKCFHWGLFEDGVHPDASEATLSATDVCSPCVDCSDFSELYPYMDALHEALSGLKDRVYQHTSYVSGSHEQNNILELLKQSLLYWNHMVQIASWRCHAIAYGVEVNAAEMLTNHFDRPIPAGLKLTMFYADLPEYMRVRSHLIDHVVPSGWVEGPDYMVYKQPPGDIVPVPYDADWTADYGAGTVDVHTTGDTSGETLSPGDFVMINDIDPSAPLAKGKAYAVVAGNIDDFTLAVPDMPATGSDSGTLIWSIVTYMVIETLTPLECGETIRFYTAAVATFYYGSATDCALYFRNNVASLGFPEFPELKLVRTNKMVVIQGNS